MSTSPLVDSDGLTSEGKIEAPTSAYGEEKKKVGELDFKETFGTVPFLEPNVRPTDEYKDLKEKINKEFGSGQCDNIGWSALCCLTGIGACYVWCKMSLINEGQWGFVMHSGRPEILAPGRYFFSHPFSEFQNIQDQGADRIECGPITIVRVPKGSVGLAYNNSLPEVLLPGRHVRTTTAFKFQRTVSLQEDLIELGPIKLFTVKSGSVRVCYNAGKVEIYREGRYAVNSPTFVVAGLIDITQQNVKFDQHKVLLDGGVSLLVEGLLTYQVVDPALLIKNLGERDLLQAVSQVSKAEIARAFSAVHLEQISSSALPGEMSAEEKAVLGKQKPALEAAEGETRHELCVEIMAAVRPMAEQWGVRVINFQLESTTLADAKYAAEYEEASLQLAKAKSKRRAVETNNSILIEQSKAKAEALRIEAEGQKAALLIQADAKAETTRIESKGRNDAAEIMDDDFAKEYAIAGQQVEFASVLKAKVLTVVPESAVGQAITAQSGFVDAAITRGK